MARPIGRRNNRRMNSVEAKATTSAKPYIRPRESNEKPSISTGAIPAMPFAPPVRLEKSNKTRRTNSPRSEEHTSELQSLMRISYAVFCLKKKNETTTNKEYYKRQ